GGQIWSERLGTRPRLIAIKVYRLLRRRQSLLMAAESGQHGGEIVQRSRQIWSERLGTRPRQRATDVDRLLRRRQSLLMAAERREIIRGIIEIPRLCLRFSRSLGHDQSKIRRPKRNFARRHPSENRRTVRFLL